MLAGVGGTSIAMALANIATASKDFANQIGFLAATLNLGFRLTHSQQLKRSMYSVNLVGPETLNIVLQWKYLKRAHFELLRRKIENLCNENGNLNCAHPSYQLFPTNESGLVLLARQARTERTPRIDRRDSACPYQITRTIERISTSKQVSKKFSSEQSAVSVENVKRMFQGDLGFAKIVKIELLESVDDHVYCFQLEDDEMPGFFTGDGAVFTHNCFGYLSYRNAKFGKIDSHIAVCGYARKTLHQAMRIAEQGGHRVVHGIVDSLWLSKPGTTREDFLELCDKISSETGFNIVLEGIYKWIVFLPSKTDSMNQVANRYFGCFESSNEVKVRGIESRRGDAPSHFKKCQSLIFKALSKCENPEELRKAARTECIDIFEEFASRLEKHDVAPVELLITRRLSKNLEEYNSQRQLSVDASTKLAREGLKLRAGQSISYVITRYKTLGQNRALPAELSKIREYDSERYIELLADSCSTILCPFGVTKRDLLTRSMTL